MSTRNQKSQRGSRPTIESLMDRALREDREALQGKSDGYIRGWVKVKYVKELTA